MQDFSNVINGEHRTSMGRLAKFHKFITRESPSIREARVFRRPTLAFDL